MWLSIEKKKKKSHTWKKIMTKKNEEKKTKTKQCLILNRKIKKWKHTQTTHTHLKTRTNTHARTGAWHNAYNRRRKKCEIMNWSLFLLEWSGEKVESANEKEREREKCVGRGNHGDRLLWPDLLDLLFFIRVEKKTTNKQIKNTTEDGLKEGGRQKIF